MASDDAAARRLLPQSSQMSSFSFTPPATFQQPRETQQRNYVFVDEHNRHKRLKVMRACEGCRRRKIKCDAATTNTWPCSACVRLKLQCIRPTGYDDVSDSQSYDDQPQVQQQQQQQPPQQPPPQQLSQQHQLQQQPQQPQQQMYSRTIDFQHHQIDPTTAIDTKPALYTARTAPADYSTVPVPSGAANTALYARVPYGEAASTLQYTTVPPSISSVESAYTSQQNVFPTPPMQHSSHTESPPDSAYITDEQAAYGNADLADLLGSLRMNEAGTAPYLNNRILASKLDNETPVADDEDFKSSLPPLVSGPGLKIRIPPELMPDDETVQHYFDLYFENVHPFVPVLDKAEFYRQWHTDRESLSPLLIEALLSIGGRLADEPSQGQQWLALATRHADSFMDVPRMSTLQALLVMLKAREAAPKRGYYYRSWMAIVQCVQMAKDLGLDEHYADHEAGHPCGSSPSECLMKTRIWQTIFICEVMIGSPQGRTDLTVTEDTVDMREPPHFQDVDESEILVSRNFVYFVRVVSFISRMNRVYARIKRSKDWGANPEFTKLNPLLHAWPRELPGDMALSFPPDGSPPWLPSCFVGNVHSYYYLSSLLLHRPQLQVLEPSSPDGRWKHHMMVCYSSAKLLCRLEEAILQSFGLDGLRNMQRGVNFTIYAILTCIVIHLVALTSPDPDFNSDAREYFTRHMRVLEQCMSAWPMPEMQKQVDSMRMAFSADIRKPFVLKQTFPYGSPSPSSKHATPPHQQATISAVTTPTTMNYRPEHPQSHCVDQMIQHQQQQQQQHQHQHLQQQHHQHHQHHQQHHQQRIDTSLSQRLPPAGYMGNAISPPISAPATDVKGLVTPLSGQSLAMMASATEGSGMPDTLSSLTPAWNPSRIFDQWNSTFGTQQSTQLNSATSQASTLSVPSSSDSVEIPTLQDIQTVHASLPQELHPVQGSATYAAPIQAQHAFVTPAMWQESVASVYEGGIKRTWDYASDSMPMLKR